MDRLQLAVSLLIGRNLERLSVALCQVPMRYLASRLQHSIEAISGRSRDLLLAKHKDVTLRNSLQRRKDEPVRWKKVKRGKCAVG